jgi:hypothetical protein
MRAEECQVDKDLTLALVVAVRKPQRREGLADFVGQSQERCTKILLFLDGCDVVDDGLVCFGE